MEALMLAGISSAFRMFSVILFGIAVDYFGPAWLFVVGGAFLAAGAFALATLASTDLNYLCLVSAIIGLSGGVTAAVPVVMIRAFPPQVRFSGISFSYNVSYAIFGGVTPVCLAALSSDADLAHVYYLLCVSVGAVILGFYLWSTPTIMRYRRDNEGRPITEANGI
jgi:MFS family permease